MPYQVIKNNLNAQFKGFLFWNRQVGGLRFGLEVVNSRIPTYNEGSVPQKTGARAKLYCQRFCLLDHRSLGHQAGPVSSKAFNNISN